MNVHPRGNLSGPEREEIRQLRKSKGLTFRELGKIFGVSHVTCSRVCKDIPAPPKKPKPPPDVERTTKIYPERPGPPVPKSRADFREQKITEIARDIHASRMRGSVQVLPALHRLHLQIHDELATMRAEEHAITGGMDAKGLLATITQTIDRLPPVLRHELRNHLEQQEGPKLVKLPDRDVG